MIIILLGPPGSGKGTMANDLAKHLGLEHVEIGDILRNKKDKKIQELMQKGKLLPNKIIVKLVNKKINKKDLILDGFPRTVAQAKMLKQKPDYVFFLQVNKKIIYTRLLKRAKIEGRSDDTKTTISARIKEYEKQTKPVLKYYSIIKIDATQTPEKVLKDILLYIKHD